MYSIVKGVVALVVGLAGAAQTGEPSWLIVSALGLLFIGWGLLWMRAARQ